MLVLNLMTSKFNGTLAMVFFKIHSCIDLMSVKLSNHKHKSVKGVVLNKNDPSESHKVDFGLWPRRGCRKFHQVRHDKAHQWTMHSAQEKIV